MNSSNYHGFHFGLLHKLWW